MMGMPLLAAGCGGGSGSFYVMPTAPDRLTLYDTVDPPTLDPARSWGVWDGRVIGMVFSNLVRFTPDAKIVPDLATHWEIAEDGLEYTFHLNPNARFSNGRPVVSDDIRYSFERILDPETGAANPWVLERIVEMDSSDDHIFRFRLEEPFTPMLGLLAMPASSVVPQEGVAAAEEEGVPFGERPMGSGPWRFVEWKHDRHIDLQRIENYWGDSPTFEHFRYRIIGNHFTAIAEFETGYLSSIDQLPDAEVIRWRNHPEWSAHVQPSQVLATDMVVFNCTNPPLDRPEVRRALCQLVRTALLIRSIKNGAATPSVGPVPPGIPGHSDDREPFPHDPEGAKAVLRDAGIADKELVFVIPSNQELLRAIGEVLQSVWIKAGVKVRVLQLEWVSYRAALRSGEFDTGFRTWFADYPDGDNYLYPLFHSSQTTGGNIGRFVDPILDDLIARSQRESDPDVRNELLKAGNTRVYEEAACLFLWHRLYYTVVHPHLKNYNVPLVFNGTRYLDEYYDFDTPAGGSSV